MPKRRVVVELQNGDAYMGVPAGEETVNGETYVVIEEPKKVHIAGAKDVEDADRMKFLKEEVDKVRDLDDI
jgi:hypothetical protein